jgi:entericidin A
MVRKVTTLALIAGTLLLTACNTVEGAGRDVSSAGNAVSKTANENK